MSSKGWSFGAASRARLETVHPRLRAVVERALDLSDVDITVVSGRRSPEEQQALYAQGRTEPGPIVTNIDGVTRKSRHNYDPALAVDLAPYVAGRGVVWNDDGLFRQIAGAMRTASRELGTPLEWGGDWVSFIDKPHWQLAGPPRAWPVAT